MGLPQTLDERWAWAEVVWVGWVGCTEGGKTDREWGFENVELHKRNISQMSRHCGKEENGVNTPEKGDFIEASQADSQ